MFNKKDEKIGVMHLITGLGVGGAENVVYDLAVNTDNNKFEVYVRSLRDSLTDLLPKFEDAGIDTKVLGITKSPIKFIHVILKLNKFIVRHKIKILHVHMFHPLILAICLKLIHPTTKIVFTYHASGLNRYVRESIILLLSPMRNIDIIFSEKSKEYFCKNKYKVIPNGIDTQKYIVNEPKFDKFTFINVGRLEDSKNQKAFIDICNKLSEYDFEILIVGKGYLENELKELVNKNKLENKIKFLGVRYDIPRLLSKSHVFILPSIREGLPIVLLEAGASSMPVISTKVGSIPLLLDRNNSFICDVEEFPQQMIETMTMYESALQKGRLLRQKVESSFSIDKISREHELIYQNLIIT